MAKFSMFLLALWVSIVPARAATYYVAPNGNDGSAGTSLTTPFKTINKAVSRTVAGDTVYLRAGTYRENVDMKTGGAAGKPITVAAYQNEVPVIKGSEVVTGWVLHSGSIWKKTGWAYNSQQVFVDFDTRPGNSLQQIGNPSSFYTSWEYPSPVGSGVSSMVAGSFFYQSQTLYVWLPDGSNPNNHVMEASVQRRLFFMNKPYVLLRGISFRHSSASAFVQQGAAVELSSYSTIEDCDIQYVDFAGLGLGYNQTNTQVRDCNISNNGNSGINAIGTKNFDVVATRMNGNNTRNFSAIWHAGGFKGATDAAGTVRDSEAANNNGAGIWFDYCDSGQSIVVKNNYLHGNTGKSEADLFMEVSSNGLIMNNIVVGAKKRGIYLSASKNMRVLNNTVVATANRSGIEVAGMPRGSATLTDNLVQNNIVTGGTSQFDLYLQPANNTSIARNRSDYNLFYRAGSIALSYGTVYSDLARWTQATGNDAHSKRADPMLEGGTASSAQVYRLKAGSPAIDVAVAMGGTVTDDYLHLVRPVGKGVDMGAFEWRTATAGTTTTTVASAESPTEAGPRPAAPAATTTTTTTTPAPAPAPSSTQTSEMDLAALMATTRPDTQGPVLNIGLVQLGKAVQVTASDRSGVAKMDVYVNGQLRASGDATLVVLSGLSAGANTIRVVASDTRSNKSETTQTVTTR